MVILRFRLLANGVFPPDARTGQQQTATKKALCFDSGHNEGYVHSLPFLFSSPNTASCLIFFSVSLLSSEKTEENGVIGHTLILLVFGLLLFGSFGFWFFEREQLGELSLLRQLETSAWWSIVTMTTVGYGDVYPKTWAGRWLVGVPLMVVGIGVLGYAIGVLANLFIEHKSKELRGMLPYTKDGHVIICNCPSTDLLLEILKELRADETWAEREFVLITDSFAELPPPLRESAIHFVSGNPAREHVLKRANIQGADRVMILTQKPNIEDCDSATLGVLVTIRALNGDIYVVAECQHEENRKLLWQGGANEIVNSGSLRAEFIVQGLQDPGVNAMVANLLTNTTGHQFYVYELQSFRGRYAEVVQRVQQQGRYAVVGLLEGESHEFLPDPDRAIALGRSFFSSGPAAQSSCRRRPRDRFSQAMACTHRGIAYS